MRRLEKTIREIGWTHAVPRLGVTDRVSRAFDQMSREVHDCVLVMRGDELGDVMTPAPRTLRPRDPIAFAINWMAVEGFRNVPIVDDLGAVLGVLTVWDVMRHLEAIFDDIDATPRMVPPAEDTSAVISMIDLGGGS